VNWGEILVALIGAGLLKFAVDGIKALSKRRQARTPEARDALHVTTADQSLAVVARARDELEDDNNRLRAEITRVERRASEAEARHDAELARRDLREAAMRAEIETLERKLRALLTEVEKLKDRHTLNEVETRRDRAAGRTDQYPGPHA